MGGEGIIETFFHMSTHIKLYHWQTKTYSRHMATNQLLLVLLPLIDTFVETYSGRYSRPNFGGSFKLDIQELNDLSAKKLLAYYVDFLKNEVPKYLKSSDTDLLNIRDSILGELNKTLYLFTLS
jgi:hypothetical protein